MSQSNSIDTGVTPRMAYRGEATKWACFLSDTSGVLSVGRAVRG